MKSHTEIAADTDAIVSVLELKFLLRSILEHHANIHIRYLLNGERWTSHFLTILLVTEKGVILNDEQKNKITSVEFLSDISQFELDKTYESYESKSHYIIN